MAAPPSFGLVSLAAFSGVATCAIGAEVGQAFETEVPPPIADAFKGGTRYDLTTFGVSLGFKLGRNVEVRRQTVF